MNMILHGDNMKRSQHSCALGLCGRPQHATAQVLQQGLEKANRQYHKSDRGDHEVHFSSYLFGCESKVPGKLTAHCDGTPATLVVGFWAGHYFETIKKMTLNLRPPMRLSQEIKLQQTPR